METIRAIGLSCSWIFLAMPLQAATVLISPSATTVAQGGCLQFTVTVQPSTYVQQITVSYQGEAGQDIGSSTPFQTTHSFDTAANGIVITATVTYTNDDPAGQTTTAVDVVGLTILGQTNPSRGLLYGYVVQSNPTGKPLTQIGWTYAWTGGSNTYQSGAVWSGKMVADGTLTVSAVVSGVTLQASQTITIAARSWPVPISCAQDNDPDYGDMPTAMAEFGVNRDRDSDIGGYIFGPRNSVVDFAPAYSLSQVSSGPCTGWWYVSTCVLKCQRETAINRHIKADGPTLGNTNFFGANINCFSTSTADFLQAVKNHEYRGTPDTFKSWDGHQGRIEAWILDYSHDAKQRIEPLLARDESSLAATVDNTILTHEAAIVEFALAEEHMRDTGPNWGGGEGLGTGQHSSWDSDWSSWTDCIKGPDWF